MVLAIGTGKSASAQETEEAHEFVRQELSQIISHEIANKIRILYGGSVKPQNVSNFLIQKDIDGALVFVASLKPTEFLALCLA